MAAAVAAAQAWESELARGCVCVGGGVMGGEGRKADLISGN